MFLDPPGALDQFGFQVVFRQDILLGSRLEIDQFHRRFQTGYAGMLLLPGERLLTERLAVFQQGIHIAWLLDLERQRSARAVGQPGRREKTSAESLMKNRRKIDHVVPPARDGSQ